MQGPDPRAPARRREKRSQHTLSDSGLLFQCLNPTDSLEAHPHRAPKAAALSGCGTRARTGVHAHGTTTQLSPMDALGNTGHLPFCSLSFPKLRFTFPRPSVWAGDFSPACGQLTGVLQLPLLRRENQLCAQLLRLSERQRGKQEPRSAHRATCSRLPPATAGR